jgi:DNA-binding transcriptional regulator YiaG
MSTTLPAVNPRQLRRQLGMNQAEFWKRIDVTQSGGSRYESGRPMPKPVRRLLGVVYLKETVTPFTPETHNT